MTLSSCFLFEHVSLYLVIVVGWWIDVVEWLHRFEGRREMKEKRVAAPSNTVIFIIGCCSYLFVY